MVTVQNFFLFRLLIKVKKIMHSCKKSMSYLVVGVAYIHKEPPLVVCRTHIILATSA